ncbi:MAG TPA: mobile mystery protein B [Pseudolabrys sp.]|nr:mobile mystery protein B [Pseudolabrys sp.]
MTGLFEEPDNATPVSPEERRDLRQTWIITRSDLNEAEQANIQQALTWARGSRYRRVEDILNENFACALHRRMFSDVWKWAGRYRLSEKTIGIDFRRIAVEMLQAFDDSAFWFANETFLPDEQAVRLHHRLVQIHPFVNGNGRHTRLMADLLIERLGGPPFSWGGGRLTDAGELRSRYIAALKRADEHDIGPLIAFARS